MARNINLSAESAKIIEKAAERLHSNTIGSIRQLNILLEGLATATEGSALAQEFRATAEDISSQSKGHVVGAEKFVNAAKIAGAAIIESSDTAAAAVKGMRG